MYKNEEFLALKNRAKLSIKELSELLGITTVDVSRIVRGENKASKTVTRTLGFYVDYLEMGV